LYELVKRRCKFIIVCDADCDSAYAFGDIGNAIRKCREDIGVNCSNRWRLLSVRSPVYRQKVSPETFLKVFMRTGNRE